VDFRTKEVILSRELVTRRVRSKEILQTILMSELRSVITSADFSFFFFRLAKRIHPHDPLGYAHAYLTMKVSTNFEADTTIRFLVIALLLLIRYVTL